MSGLQPQTEEVSAADAGQTLAARVRVLLSPLPWSKARALVSTGRVSVDGEKVLDPASRVQAGAKIEVNPQGKKERTGGLADDAILYLDNDVVVVSKPAQMMSVPYEQGDKDTLSDLTAIALKRRQRPRSGGGRSGGRDPMIGVVQRLDKDTTGVLVFARNVKAKRILQEQFRVHSIGRRYLALAHGQVDPADHETHIIQNRGDGLRGSWGTRAGHRGPPPKDAKRALTHIRPLELLGPASLIECELETGRQHQIRIHLSESGHPLLGERVYIRDYELPRLEASRPMLHAADLAFDHPRTGKRLSFHLDPPEDFQKRLESLRR